MKTRITLICHGATASNRSASFPADEPLEGKALEQTVLLKGRFDHADRIVVSPLLRARQTAEALELPEEIEPALAECDYGLWAGREMEAIGRQHPDAFASWMTDFSAAPHGGESMSCVLTRVGDWLDGNMGQGGHTVAITHASVIRASILHVLQATPTAFWKIDVEPLSRTQLAGDGRRWTLRLPALAKEHSH